MGNGKTMLEVAKELGVSKDVVKYHKRKLADDDWISHDGVVYIFETGVEKIRSGLSKEENSYSKGFESNVINRLVELEIKQIIEFDNLREKVDFIYEKLKSLAD